MNMIAAEYLKNTLKVIQNDEEFIEFSEPRQRLIDLISEIIDDNNQENVKNKATILIAGVCDAIPESLMIRSILVRLRRELWGEAFGFATIKFSQKNESGINLISNEFKELMVGEYLKKHNSKQLLKVE
jgi:hypothetical protein